MSPRRARRLAAGGIVVLIAALLLPPFVNANRFRHRLAATMQLSIGRSVSMGDVHFTLLPRPGFVITNLVITDDPVFSAEPVLRAGSVTAALRLTSLWRGRLEIARLSFEYPSLNLVRAPDGRWNVEALLRQASQVPAAPTAAPRPQSRPRFPYIEADNGRINFRQGQEKLPHALMDADFSLWLEAEDQWNMRLEARPTRTDAHLSDTGTLRISGLLRRADKLAATAMRLRVELENAQLGQWTSLLTGRDRGWRGGTDVEARLEGTVSDFTFTANAEVADFHRHDIPNRDSLDARIECTGNASLRATPNSSDPGLSSAGSYRASLQCAMPLAQGTATLGGDIKLQRDPDFDLRVGFREVPAAWFANFYRRVKRDVPEDLDAQGAFSGEYRFLRDRTATSGAVVIASGRGLVTGLQLDSESRGASLAFSNFDVEFLPPRNAPRISLTPAPNELTVSAAGVHLGAAVPVYLSARLNRTGVVVAAKGDADLKQLLSAASLFGLSDPRYRPSGFADLNLAVTGIFANFTPPRITGTAQLRQAAIQVDGVAAPLVLQSATLQFAPEAVTVQRLAARLEGSPAVIEGTVTIPRRCPAPVCASTFDLRAADLNLDELNRALNPRYRSSAWLSFPRIFGGKTEKSSLLMALQAHGNISIGRLAIKNLVATRATGRLQFDQGKIALSAFHAELLTGRHLGSWSADLTGAEPVFTGNGTVEALPLAQLNSLLRSPLGTGTIRLTYDLTMRGSDATQLRRTADGEIRFRWNNGSWRTAGQTQSVQFSDWTGTLNLRDEVADLTASVMQTRTGPYQASGRAGFDRGLSLRLSGPRDQMLVSGTLQNATVAISPAEGLPAADSASNFKNATTGKNADPAKVRN